MKKLFFFFLIIVITFWSCSTSKDNSFDKKNDLAKTESDTIRIANDSIEYEIIIIDGGFNSFLYGKARQRGYYSQAYLEGRNILMVREYNNRVLQPMRFSSDLYTMQIDYQNNINYGYEVNYMLYNYFIYFQIANNQKLMGFLPRP